MVWYAGVAPPSRIPKVPSTVSFWPGEVVPTPTLPFRIVYPVPPGVKVIFGFVPVAAKVKLPVEPTVNEL